MEELKNINISGVEFVLNTGLEKYTTIKLKSVGSIALVSSESALAELIKLLKSKSISFHMVGWGANQVLLHGDKTLYVKLLFPIDKSALDSGDSEFELPASFPLNILTSYAIKYGFLGWEVFTGIPATLGGAICMNAGTALGEIGSYIKAVRILRPSGEIYTYKCNNDSFSYRNNNFLREDEIILSAVIFHKGRNSEIGEKIKAYLQYRKDTQPLTTKNCGSVFKNLDKLKAGKLIDELGLKGFGKKNVLVSFKHGNFIENVSDGTAEDFDEVSKALILEIERFSGAKFEFEAKVY